MLRLLVPSAALLAVGAILSIPPDGQGWGWTYWGMRYEQVAAGSGGKVGALEPMPPAHLDTGEPRLIATAGLEQDGQKMDAAFFFDSQSRRLMQVSVGPPEFSRCRELRRSTVKRLGQPYKVYVVRAPERGGRTYSWANDGRGNHVTYADFEPGHGDPGACSLIYAPARPKRNAIEWFE